MPSATAAGSASSKTITGALPPSSRCTRFSVSAAVRAISLPVATSPVSETMRTSRWRTSPAPTGSPSPVITLRTPGGRISAASCAKRSVVSGVCSDGLTIWTFPAASALEPLGQRLLRRLDGAVDVGLRPARDLGNRLARRGIQDLHRPALDRVHPLTADEVLLLGHRYAHGQPPGRNLRINLLEQP